jgi:hypothetical protein
MKQVDGGTRFKFRPMRFVLALHSGKQWHGLTNGKLAAVWEWLCMRPDRQEIYNSLVGHGCINCSNPEIGFPWPYREMENRIAEALVDHVITGDIDQSVMITRPWHDRFFTATEDFLTRLRDPVLVKQWNRDHPGAVEVYGVYLQFSELRRKWEVTITYGYDGSAWHLYLCRRDTDFVGVKGTTFPVDASNQEFDELLHKWMVDNMVAGKHGRKGTDE